ncbi:type IV pilus biogenesis/stability protein PilW [Azoarcus indigens]|uniref:Type IV pilus assembly protein PilF n=1 Tax=Azoarcus indigens TaxID=29545 RepID=A0A4R6DZN1_9RHOO|nr:type IV pilus biogenesis/stability protein PilW [Azoarcus indigens]NMG64846.1 type IV pilus biogenesis/stability protein PilW [Azoarcus indigens]TDN50384.1 type IV pilus assembly protein PilF [Azoarcus indigens]
MTRFAAIVSIAAVALLAGCATGPGQMGDSAAAPSRPMADTTPANQGEARARAHVELGLAYIEIARYDVALDEAKTALSDSPGYGPAYHLMGLIYMLLDERTQAQDNFERALRAAPGDPDFSNSYGWFLCQQGRESEGLAYFNRAARNPYYRYPTRPYTNAGLCLLRLKNDSAAEAQFASAVEADPTNGRAMYELAGIAYRRGDYELARTRLIRLHQALEPTAASAWLGLRTERRLGHRDAEASYAAQLRSRFADSPEYQLMLQGKYE